MKKEAQKIYSVNYILFIKTFLLGVILTESIYMLKIIAGTLINNISDLWLWMISITYFFGFTYCLFPKIKERVSFIFKSLTLNECKLSERTSALFITYRIDLLFPLLMGVIVTCVFDFFGLYNTKKWLIFLSWRQLFIIILLPFVFWLSGFLRKSLLQNFDDKATSFFMSDKEINNKNDDKFMFNDKAESFAESIYNHGLPDSLVFGIDAPWGTGKSSFINLCKEYWKGKYISQIIVYNFEPLRYENREDLLRIFIDGLVKEIKKQVFVPELGSLLSKYAKMLKNTKPSFSYSGLRFDLSIENESIDDVFKKLEEALLHIDKKVIIIIDDLDRLDFLEIQEILFVVKKSFMLPNISYVLCYDTENIAARGRKNFNTEKISEFLEKFVNMKISLYLDKKLLLKDFIENKDSSLAENLSANNELVSKAVEGLRNIFESKDFHLYISFIGDARKLKRLVNTIVLLGIEQTDFQNCDFDKQDIIHLILIYINYPNVFRKIYNTETQGRKGFFSVVSKNEDGYPKSKNSDKDGKNSYENSTYYTEYIKTLSKRQKFLIDKVFSVNQKFIDSSTGKPLNRETITQEMITSYACFNGTILNDRDRNLERYLNLIVNQSNPIKTEQYRFYVNLKDDILSVKTIKDVLNSKEFSFLENEERHERLWRTLVNSLHAQFTPEKAKEVINYAVLNLHKHSLLKIEKINIGFRSTLVFFIVKLLDKVGWNDIEGEFLNNDNKNIHGIAEWIFGEGEHISEGIINALSKEERGVMGLYDLLKFRLYCCAERGSDLFNLERSLYIHGNPQAIPSSDFSIKGDISTRLIGEMREISQKIFRIFKVRFIDKKINIFDEVDKLSIENVCGKYSEFVKLKGNLGEIIDLDNRLLILKNNMKIFILYQLGNSMSPDNSLGCGYYDITGYKDNQGIRKTVNDYIFGYCFNPEISESNCKYFIDYLLSNLSRTYTLYGNTNYIPNIDEFTISLDKKELIMYWQKHRSIIKSKISRSENREVHTSNYTVSYANGVDGIYNVLDAFLINSDNV
ncbi:KAP P-loop domain protein [Ruminiclostridium papyrosolvens DSM 2782]|uniref:KAP P-loop domain protein n=1 Tax=Ruminiclostridium papyrosolvens DSM 2782 TaxID=588581 RepID=F1TD98_9FIRM|nr:P-loop NTPase fold protein [Ruminiclostridium papyrosolvens]EGD47536.1 KAP P-loop domain protein [Ruminiclostridium papyrosolvens DSM 2782]WES36517.1 P-loop NTPase fold protein [Ruminiclostridium papyrosolvens DSM 2782]